MEKYRLRDDWDVCVSTCGNISWGGKEGHSGKAISEQRPRGNYGWTHVAIWLSRLRKHSVKRSRGRNVHVKFEEQKWVTVWSSNFISRCVPQRIKARLKQILGHQGSEQHCSQQPKGWNNLERLKQTSINRWMDRQNVIQTYNGMSSSLRKKNEILILATVWMNL